MAGNSVLFVPLQFVSSADIMAINVFLCYRTAVSLGRYPYVSHANDASLY